MSLSTIQNQTGHHHLILALIIIMKHATFLRILDMKPKPALIQAELDYQKENIDLKIQQYLLASSQEHSIELFTRFIMATDIESTHPNLLNQTLLTHNLNQVHRKDHWLKQLLKPLKKIRKDK